MLLTLEQCKTLNDYWVAFTDAGTQTMWPSLPRGSGVRTLFGCFVYAMYVVAYSEYSYSIICLEGTSE